MFRPMYSSSYSCSFGRPGTAGRTRGTPPRAAPTPARAARPRRSAEGSTAGRGCSRRTAPRRSPRRRSGSQRGDLRVHVGVRRALDEAALARQQGEAAEPVPPRLHQEDQPEEHREVRSDRRRDLVGEHGCLRPDPAPQRVRERRDDGDPDEAREQPALDEPQPREREDVEGGIAPELLLGDAEGQLGAVPPQREGVPLPRGRRSPRTARGRARRAGAASGRTGRSLRGSARAPLGPASARASRA